MLAQRATLTEHAKTFPHEYWRGGRQGSNSSIHTETQWTEENQWMLLQSLRYIVIFSNDHVIIIAEFFEQ